MGMRDMRYIHARMLIYPSAFGLRVYEHSWVYISSCPSYTQCIFVFYNIFGKIPYYINSFIYLHVTFRI